MLALVIQVGFEVVLQWIVHKIDPASRLGGVCERFYVSAFMKAEPRLIW